MTTVAQFIAHLQTLPQDLTVQCLLEKQRGYESWTIWENLRIDDHINVVGSFVEIGEK
jgi:hypothetical protein